MRWEGAEQFSQNFDVYGQRVHFAVRQVALHWQAVFEKEAKEDATWTDRTANARQTLHAFIEELSDETVRLYLSHGMPYGIWLEVRFAGRYAIIWPTIERHLEDIRVMLQGIFG